jgi:hypothetical protein
VQDERRRRNAAQQRPNIGIAQRLQDPLDGTRARCSAQQAGPPAFRLGVAGQAQLVETEKVTL